MAGKRPTGEQVEKLIEAAVLCLERRMATHQIKAAFRTKFGVQAARTIMRYVARARARLIARAKTTKLEQRSLALATYEAILRDPEASLKERLDAQKAIVDLLGLKSPQQIEVAGRPGGSAIAVGLTGPEQMTDAELDAAIEQCGGARKIRLRSTGGSNGTGGTNGRTH